MTEQGKFTLEKYKRKFSKRKLFLLGNARTGISLIHKCLLITGLDGKNNMEMGILNGDEELIWILGKYIYYRNRLFS
ncbi:MAG: hypothetical protein ACFFB0_05445 [Promethearchaeota archaeon]